MGPFSPPASRAATVCIISSPFFLSSLWHDTQRASRMGCTMSVYTTAEGRSVIIFTSLFSLGGSPATLRKGLGMYWVR